MFSTDDNEGVLTAFYGICTDDLIAKIFDYEWENHGKLQATFPPHFYPFSLFPYYQDSTLFPHMNPLALSFDATWQFYVTLFKYFGWERCAKFYEYPAGLSSYKSFMETFKAADIDVIGDPDLHALQT